MMNEENESSDTVNQERAGKVIDDIWSSFPNVHLRVLTAEKESVEIQICDCGMSGQCRPQGWARIERHNRQRLANAIAAAPSSATAAPKCVKCGHSNFNRVQGECDEPGDEDLFCGCKCEFAEPVTAPAPWRDEGDHAWEIRPNVTCVECPHCCFAFAAVHTSQRFEVDQWEGYDCPNCEGCPDARRKSVTTTAASVISGGKEAVEWQRRESEKLNSGSSVDELSRARRDSEACSVTPNLPESSSERHDGPVITTTAARAAEEKPRRKLSGSMR